MITGSSWEVKLFEVVDVALVSLVKMTYIWVYASKGCVLVIVGGCPQNGLLR